MTNENITIVAILAVSLAASKAAASEKGISFWLYLPQPFKGDKIFF